MQISLTGKASFSDYAHPAGCLVPIKCAHWPRSRHTIYVSTDYSVVRRMRKTEGAERKSGEGRKIKMLENKASSKGKRWRLKSLAVPFSHKALVGVKYTAEKSS